MKTAIFSDIHSNPAALEKCLAHAESYGCTKFVCLGDIVGYGYDPNACIEICRRKGMLCLMGNHEAGLTGRLPLGWFSYSAYAGIVRQKEQLSPEVLKWMDNLPFKQSEMSDDGFPIVFSHGTYEFPERFDYIRYSFEALHEFRFLHRDRLRALFVGHTHFANYFTHEKEAEWTVNEGYIDLEDASPINVAEHGCTIVNVGSVGYPRNQPYSVYCIYDDATHTATHRILDFDFDDYRRQMEQANIEVPLWIQFKQKEAESSPIGFR